MNTSLGFRLNTTTGLDGVGFINPFPLPDFDNNLSRLHLLRRSYIFANWDRVSQVQGSVADAGAVPEATNIRSNNASQNINIENPNVDYAGGFTFAVALTTPSLQGASAADRVEVIQTEGMVAASAGFRLQLIESGSSDLGINARVFTDAGRANVTRTSLSLPGGGAAFWVFVSFDGSTLRLAAPALWGLVDSASIDTGITGNTAPANTRLIMGRKQDGNNNSALLTGQTYWGLAQYGRGLADSEIVAEHAKLVAWAAALGATTV